MVERALRWPLCWHTTLESSAQIACPCDQGLRLTRKTFKGLGPWLSPVDEIRMTDRTKVKRLRAPCERFPKVWGEVSIDEMPRGQSKETCLIHVLKLDLVSLILELPLTQRPG